MIKNINIFVQIAHQRIKFARFFAQSLVYVNNFCYLCAEFA